ncbi:MAG: HD-GYP domain-containing protein [Candidatus Kapaibacterium sp.]
MTMSTSIVVIGETRVANVLSHVWSHVLPQADVRRASNAVEAATIVSAPADIVVIDWGFTDSAPADIVSSLRARPSYGACVVAALAHDAMQMTEARFVGVDIVIDLASSGNVEHLLTSQFHVLIRLSESSRNMKRLEVELQNAKRYVEDVIDALQRTIQCRLPDSVHRARFVEDAVLWIAKQFEFDKEVEIDIDQLRYAAKLAMLGRMHLPDADRNTRVTLDGAPTNVLTAAVPLKADEILKESTFLSGARSILRNMYENYDGTGFPDRIQHWQIPLASRILRVVIDAEELNAELSGRYADTLEELRKLSRRVYDQRVVLLLDEYVNVIAKKSRTEHAPKSVLLVDLTAGMVLASDIVTNAGLKLMNAGTELQSHLIERLMSHNTMDPILGNIYVTERKKSVAAL